MWLINCRNFTIIQCYSFYKNVKDVSNSIKFLTSIENLLFYRKQCPICFQTQAFFCQKKQKNNPGNTETEPPLKSLIRKIRVTGWEVGIDVAIAGLIVRRVIHYTTAAPKYLVELEKETPRYLYILQHTPFPPVLN